MLTQASRRVEGFEFTAQGPGSFTALGFCCLNPQDLRSGWEFVLNPGLWMLGCRVEGCCGEWASCVVLLRSLFGLQRFRNSRSLGFGVLRFRFPDPKP